MFREYNIVWSNQILFIYLLTKTWDTILCWKNYIKILTSKLEANLIDIRFYP